VELSDIQFIDIYGNNTLANQPDVTNTSVLGLPAFYAAVRFVSRNMAALPKLVLQAGVEQPKHYLNSVLNRRINAYANAYITWSTLYFHAMVYGNGYLYISREGSRVTKLENLNPQAVTPFRVDGTKYFMVRGKDESAVLFDDEVIHIMALTHNGVCGCNPIQLMCQTFEKILALQSFESSYWKNGTHVNGVIEVPGGLSKEQMDTMRQALANFTTAKNAGKTPVLPFGAHWVGTTATNEASQVAELSKLTDVHIGQITGVPPTAIFSIQGAGAWSTVEQLDKAVVKYTLRDWVEQSEHELCKLFTTAEDAADCWINIDLDAILRGDPSRITSSLAEVVGGTKTQNEHRVEEGRKPLPGGDVLLTPVNVAQKPTGQQAPADQKPVDQPADYAQIIRPLVEAAVIRVDGKTSKAFDRHKTKRQEDFAEWQTGFADEQASYLANELKPVVDVYGKLTGKTISVADLCTAYASQITALDQTKTYSSTLLTQTGELFQ